MVGFESLSADDVRALAGNEDTAWWFFFAEHFTEPRFGLDLPAAGNPASFADWNDATWANATLDAAGRLGAGSFNVAAAAEVEARHAAGTDVRLARQQFVDRLDPFAVPVPPRHARNRPAAAEANVMSGIDPQIPITLLPVRIETRFAGTAAAPRLLVRLYPDDVHIDHHDPRLTSGEVSAGENATGRASARALPAIRPGRSC